MIDQTRHPIGRLETARNTVRLKPVVSFLRPCENIDNGLDKFLGATGLFAQIVVNRLVQCNG
jgi:hypothetical protein